jgi:hypothetical protein
MLTLQGIKKAALSSTTDETDVVAVSLPRVAWQEIFLNDMNLFIGSDSNPIPRIRVAAVLGAFSGDESEELMLKFRTHDLETLYLQIKSRSHRITETIFLLCINRIAKALGLVDV